MTFASNIWCHRIAASFCRSGTVNVDLRTLVTFLLLLAAGILARGPVALAQQTDLRYAYPEQPSTSPLGVDFQTGRLAVSYTDLSIGPIKLVRSWANGSNFSLFGSSFGDSSTSPAHRYGWSASLSQGVSAETIGGQSGYKVQVDRTSFSFLTWNVAPFTRPQGINENGTNLAILPASFVFTNKSGDVYTFSRQSAVFSNVTKEYGLLQNVVYADGSRLDYSYNAASKVRSVATNRGYAMVFDYGPSGNIETACGFNTTQLVITNSSTCAGAKLKVSYSYDGGNNLTSVTDVIGRVVTISSYTVRAGPACISLPNSATCEIAMTYGRIASNNRSPLAAVDQVASQTKPNGDVINYTWDNGEDIASVPLVAGRPRFSTAAMADQTGSNVVLDYDRGLLIQYVGNGKSVRLLYPQNSFAYGGAITAASAFFRPALPIYVTNAEGNHDVYRYDSDGHVILHSIWPKGTPPPVGKDTGRQLFSSDPDLALCCALNDEPLMPAGAITYTQSYYKASGPGWTGCGTGPAEAKLCAKPISQTDPLNGITDFDYYPEHGGIKSETGPLVNNVRPQTRYTYAPKYAYIAAPNGGHVQAPGLPVWVLTSKSSCKVGAASSTGGCVTPGDEVVTSYEYGPDAGPNNLLLRGMVVTADGTSPRTCYTYDWLGNKVSETQPKAGMGACP
jgi:hypothetical protein